MNLGREKKKNNKLVGGIVRLLCFISMVMFIGPFMNVIAATTHTTKPSVKVESGDKNPFKHDSGVCTINFCTRHPSISKVERYSKITAFLEVKSNMKNSKVMTKKYQPMGIVSGLAFCTSNSGTYSFYQKTDDSDKYTAKARWVTLDCFCLDCFSAGYSDAEAYSNTNSSWVSE